MGNRLYFGVIEKMKLGQGADVSLAIKSMTEFCRFYPKGMAISPHQMTLVRDALLKQRSALNKAVEHLKRHGDMVAVQDVLRGM